MQKRVLHVLIVLVQEPRGACCRVEASPQGGWQEAHLWLWCGKRAEGARPTQSAGHLCTSDVRTGRQNAARAGPPGVCKQTGHGEAGQGRRGDVALVTTAGKVRCCWGGDRLEAPPAAEHGAHTWPSDTSPRYKPQRGRNMCLREAAYPTLVIRVKRGASSGPTRHRASTRCESLSSTQEESTASGNGEEP